MLSRGFIVTVLAVVACANPVARSMQVHESRAEVPAAFALKGAAAPDAVLNMRLALVQGDMAGLEKALMDVSTPGNALYGQHLSKEEVESYVAPKPAASSTVLAWLKENDIEATTASTAGDWLSFSIPVSKANELLDADFAEYTHVETGTTAIRTLSYSIPADLKGALDFVHPTTSFVPPMKKGPLFFKPLSSTPATNLTSAAVPPSCNSTVTPTCLQDLYRIPTTAATDKSNVLGVSGFMDLYANKADLMQFLKEQRPDIPSTTTFTLQTLDGGSNSQIRADAGLEANLDVQYTIGLATGVPVTFISVGENNTDGLDGGLDLINALIAESNPPTVLTTSYDFNEPDITLPIANSVCNAFMQLGARGTSILFSSGDGGVSGSHNQSCTTFVPTFPSGCPYLTSVGATQGITETAANFSSGGFSNLFAQPSYQTSAVSTYLSALGTTNSGMFNRSGRAFPDVSAQGANVQIVLDAETGAVWGTSCSSPIFASVIALLNDELAAAGKPPLGFLNPWLYSTAASALNDITTGNNLGCDTNGFPATKGWDPVTGLGTPNYAALRTAAGL